MASYQTIDAGGLPIAVRKDLRVPMRDGVELAADAYSAPDEKPRPALVALSPYGKELQALALTMPPQRRPSPMWDGCIEAGDIARIVEEDYVHVIGDLRGSGHSGGEHIGNYNAGGVSLGEDAYDFIEWVAAQPWCDGNVGMVGISYFGSMQVLAAAEREGSARRAAALRDRLIAAVLRGIPGARLTGHRTERLPGHASFCFPGTSGEAVLLELERAGVLCSSGSACAAGSDEPSAVLTAMGLDRETAQTAVRFTFTAELGEPEIDQAAKAVAAAVAAVARLGGLTPPA